MQHNFTILSLCQRLNTDEAKLRFYIPPKISKCPTNQVYLKTFQLLFFIHLLKRLIRQPRVSSVLKLVLLCSRDASEPETNRLCGYSKASKVSVWALTRKNVLEIDSQLTCRRAKSQLLSVYFAKRRGTLRV